MKLTIDRTAFFSALSHVQSVVERRTISPILANVLLSPQGSKLRLTTTDLDISVQEEVAANIQDDAYPTTVNALTLYEIVRKLPDGSQIELKHNLEAHQLHVKCGRARFQLPTLPAEDFSASVIAELPHRFEISAEDLRNLFHLTRFSMSTEDARYYLNGINFHLFRKGKEEVLRAVATDGHRLALAEIKAPEGSSGMPGIIIPRKTVMEICRLLEGESNTVTLSLSLTQIVFSFGNIHVQSRLIDGNFPNYEEVIPKHNTQELVVDTDALKEAVDRVALLSQEKTRGIKLILSKNQLTVSVSSPDIGSATEEMEVKYSGDHRDTGFNARYLLEILQQITTDDVHCFLGEESAPVIFKNGDNASVLFVLMPMRL